MSGGNATQSWTPEHYARNAGFVAELGQPVVELLDPKPGERILDLGCGDGVLTERLAETVEVVGVDSSPAQVAGACGRGVDARVMDGRALSFDREFDAVFTNAALHWMTDPDAVIRGVVRALKPGGRFVGEFGGHGNVAAITVALIAVLQRRGLADELTYPWYFPTADEYRARLEAHGFEVSEIALFPRLTPIPTGLDGWLDTFGEQFLRLVPESERPGFRAEVADLLRPYICDSAGRWTADYVRLRFAARLAA